jgi:hypothetical protein
LSLWNTTLRWDFGAIKGFIGVSTGVSLVWDFSPQGKKGTDQVLILLKEWVLVFFFFFKGARQGCVQAVLTC